MPLQADLDGDGIVTADEMALALKLDHEGDGVIDVDLDLDGDGIVTAAEMKLALKADKDGDGMITQAELLKARDAPSGTPADRRHAALLAARVASSLSATEQAEDQSWAVDQEAEPLASLFFKKRDRQMLISLQQREERRRRAEELARAAAKIMEDEAAAARQQREAAMTSAERMMRGGKKKKKKSSMRRKSSSRKKKGSPPRPPPLETSMEPPHQKKLPSPLARDRARKAKTWGKAASTLLERFDSDVLMVEDEYGELRLTPEMRMKVDELFVEIGGGPDIDAKSFRGALVHLGIVVSDNEAASMFEAADSDGGGTLDRDEFADTIAGVLAPLVELRRESVRPSILLPEMSSILSLQSLQTDILQEVLDRDDSVAQFVQHASEEFTRVESNRQAELMEKFKWKRSPTPAPVPAPVVVVEAPPPKRQEKKKPAPQQKNDKKPKKRLRRSPWHLYEKLRPVLRPHASDELDKAYMEHHPDAELDAELSLIQGELRSRLAPATEDEWRTASGFHNTGADLAALGKKESKWAKRFRGMGTLKRNEDGTVSSHAKAEAAAGIVRERFPLRQAFSPRRVVQSSERDACFRKFSSINCDEPFTRNGREARLLRRCGRVDDLERALQGFDIVYRGQLSSVKLAEALREVLKDVDDEPDPFHDDVEGIHFRLEDVDAETVGSICKKLAGGDEKPTPYWTCPCGMARNLQNQETCSKCHAPRHSPLSDFVDLVKSCTAFYAVQPLKQALDNALLVPMDRPGPLCWANLTRPCDGLTRNPGPKSTWRTSGKKKKKRRRRKTKDKLPKRREFTLNDDDTAMKLRGEFSVDGADSLENRMMAMGPVASVADMSGALSPLTP